MICVLAAAGAGCGAGGAGGAGGGEAAGDAPGYRQIYEQVFAPSCSTGPCHAGPRGVAELSFSDLEASYARVVGGAPTQARAAADGLKLVAPGDPERSLLYQKLALGEAALAERGWGAAMPWGGVAGPGPKTLEAMRRWIAAGAPLEGADFEADTAKPDAGYLACDATDEAGLRACHGEPEDPGTLRLFSARLEIPPRAEIGLCTEVLTTTEDLLVTASAGRQMVGGHHVALFIATAPKGTSEPYECLDDMATFRFVAGSGGKGGRDFEAPPGHAVRVPAGRVLVIQSHYVNTADAPKVAVDAFDLALAGPGETPTAMDSFVINATDMRIPAKAVAYETIKTCDVLEPMTVRSVTGHMHEMGVWFDLQLWRQAVETPEVLFHSTDGPVMRDFAGFVDLPEPLELAAGDVLRVVCRWTNPRDEEVRFPDEMCAAIGYYTPGRGALLCSGSDEALLPWGDDGGGGGDVPGCVPAGNPGNEKGVGRYCTVDGEECDGLAASLCLEPFNPGANYCSLIFCSSDAECGAGATCTSGTGGSACVPNECLDD